MSAPSVSQTNEVLSDATRGNGLKEQINREPLKLPTLEIKDKPFWDLEFDDFTLLNYNHHPVIKFPVAV